MHKADTGQTMLRHANLVVRLQQQCSVMKSSKAPCVSTPHMWLGCLTIKWIHLNYFVIGCYFSFLSDKYVWVCVWRYTFSIRYLLRVCCNYINKQPVLIGHMSVHIVVVHKLWNYHAVECLMNMLTPSKGERIHVYLVEYISVGFVSYTANTLMHHQSKTPVEQTHLC